jgi:AhpD family alkylhydroperoxidase
VTGVRLVEAAQAPLLARRYYAGGDPGPITAALANVPELLEVAMPFLATVLGASAVEVRTKELVILRTSAVLGCRYCVQTHTTAASDAGLSRAEVAALRGEAPVAAAFPSPRERAVIAWAETVAGGPGPVAGAPRAALLEHFGDHQVVELTMLAGATIMLNRFCTALELPTPADVVARLAAEGWP